MLVVVILVGVVGVCILAGCLVLMLFRRHLSKRFNSPSPTKAKLQMVTMAADPEAAEKGEPLTIAQEDSTSHSGSSGTVTPALKRKAHHHKQSAGTLPLSVASTEDAGFDDVLVVPSPFLADSKLASSNDHRHKPAAKLAPSPRTSTESLPAPTPSGRRSTPELQPADGGVPFYTNQTGVNSQPSSSKGAAKLRAADNAVRLVSALDADAAEADGGGGDHEARSERRAARRRSNASARAQGNDGSDAPSGGGSQSPSPEFNSRNPKPIVRANSGNSREDFLAIKYDEALSGKEAPGRIKRQSSGQFPSTTSSAPSASAPLIRRNTVSGGLQSPSSHERHRRSSFEPQSSSAGLERRRSVGVDEPRGGRVDQPVTEAEGWTMGTRKPSPPMQS